MSDNKVVDVILHCQKQIKKERLPEEKLLHYLGRLTRLRITVQDLAETGIGRTVNSLSRNEGPVGQAADTLVRSWKRMVSEQQSQAEQESEEESDSNSGTSEDEDDTRKREDDESYNLEDAGSPETAQAHQFNSSQSSADDDGRGPTYPDGNRRYEEGGDDDIDDDIDDPYMENGFMNMANVHTDEEEEDEDEEDNDSDSSDRLQIADEAQNGRHVTVKQEVVPKQETEYYHDDDDDQSFGNAVEKTSHQRSRENEERKQNYESNSHVSHTRTDRNHSSQSSKEKESRKEHKHHVSKSKEESKDRSSKHGDHHQHKSHSHHSSSKSDKPKESKSEHHKSHKDKEKHRSKEHREKHKDVKSEKDRKFEKERRDNSSSSHHQSKEKGQDAGSSNSPKKSSLDSKKYESNEERKRRDNCESSHPSSSKKSKLTINQEIDSASGINFEDALGCLDTSASKHKKPKREEPEKLNNNRHESSTQRYSSHSHKSESSKKDSSSSKHSRDRHSGSSKYSEQDLDKKSKHKAQSKIESVIKPVVNISPNYKPISSSLATLPRPSNSSNGLQPPISITPADLTDLGPDYFEGSRGNSYEVSQDDAISTMLSNRNKNARSKVYSGVKSARHGVVPSLFDQCMQVIKDNIADLGYTGGIPYDILKPALERANPQQLMNIEAQNDYLIGETDELWQFHCKRDFRGKCPDETESWRELYERCKEEQQLKFEKIKKQMKRSIASAEPVRKAKLAYVDTSCGPRFNLQKAQTIKNGMKTLKIKEEKGPGRGVSSSASAGFNNPKKSGGDNVKLEEASVIIGADSRAGHAPAPSVSRESSAAKLKPKKAPLMQKTMKLIRSLNRR